MWQAICTLVHIQGELVNWVCKLASDAEYMQEIVLQIDNAAMLVYDPQLCLGQERLFLRGAFGSLVIFSVWRQTIW